MICFIWYSHACIIFQRTLVANAVLDFGTVIRTFLYVCPQINVWTEYGRRIPHKGKKCMWKKVLDLLRALCTWNYKFKIRRFRLIMMPMPIFFWLIDFQFKFGQKIDFQIIFWWSIWSNWLRKKWLKLIIISSKKNSDNSSDLIFEHR